tara:strand:+ start:479 stop:661 length:183 start_codon:yes stop_codon:yes gene_type:complete
VEIYLIGTLLGVPNLKLPNKKLIYKYLGWSGRILQGSLKASQKCEAFLFYIGFVRVCRGF